MADYLLPPGTLSGEVRVPGSKSAAHRGIIAAALATGRSRVNNCGASQDIQVTAGAMERLGARLTSGDGGYDIQGAVSGPLPGETEIYCGESGSTLRFLLPVALARGGSFCFRGDGRLGDRPLDA